MGFKDGTLGPNTDETDRIHLCDHGITFDEQAARALLDASPPDDSPEGFIMGSPATVEIRKRWPRGWFTDAEPCPKGCGYRGIYYASFAHYTMGDW